jgi:hypothetical protein
MLTIDPETDNWVPTRSPFPMTEDTSGWTRERMCPENWVQDSVEILVSPDRTRFQYNGTEYWLERKDVEDNEPEGHPFHYESFVLRGNEWEEGYELASVGRFGKKGNWDATDDAAEGIWRDHADPLLAGALIVFMCV